MASEANLGRAHSGLWADDDGVEYCKAHGTFQCQFCVDLEPIVAALLADVRQEQHEATAGRCVRHFKELSDNYCRDLHDQTGWAHAAAQAGYRFASTAKTICEWIAAAPPPTKEDDDAEEKQ